MGNEIERMTKQSKKEAERNITATTTTTTTMATTTAENRTESLASIDRTKRKERKEFISQLKAKTTCT